MLKNRPQTQSELEFVCIDQLVPSDHLLRKIDKHIDFGFIHDLVKPL
ncbi:IS5/IS1182 family transposase, partial [Saccharophagus degradans]|nr:IS5/IS1182 family transposase [Saccharophagus degradans]MDO6609542.1 IS5/IS1182 family transposase [Saccharophagus degradans]